MQKTAALEYNTLEI